MTKKFRVGILGATGLVGQRFIQLLEDHPQFEITALAASDRSEARSFGDVCSWKLATPMPQKVRAIDVQPCRPPLDCDLIFSSLPSSIAVETEPQKILGLFSNGAVTPASFRISAQCNRVNVLDGHTEAVAVKLKQKATVANLIEAMERFRGEPQQFKLHSAPARPVVVMRE